MQDILKLLRRDTDLLTPHFLRLAALSGLANAAVLAIVNMSVQGSADGAGSKLRGIILFCLAIGLYAISQKALMIDTCERVERLISELRVRLLEAVSAAEFLEIEQIGRAEIFGNLSRETQVLSQSAPNMVVAVQSAVLLAASMTYMFFLSKWAFVLLTLATVVGAAFHLSRAKQASVHIQDAARTDNALIEGFSDVIDGFREVKLNRSRSEELSDSIRRVSRQSSNSRILVHSLNAHDFVLSQLTFFTLTGLMVFVVPSFGTIDTKTVAMTTTATLFMLGPVGALVGNFPIFNNANEAARRICELEDKLLAGTPPHPTNQPLGTFSGFEEIAIDDISFSYPAPDGVSAFTVGPNSLRIRRGDCIFITGGNGSGKTTFINLLLTLIPAHAGGVTVDGVAIDEGNRDAYRNLFSVIFSDNHLFSTLYGVPSFDAAEAEHLLQDMEIAHKVKIEGNRYSTTDLSGGQRKRLALITAQLERKPILVLDEWAADQDPVFREKFYRQIMPALRKRGLTIIAITHDDRYFDVADARYHMDEGMLHQLS